MYESKEKRIAANRNGKWLDDIWVLQEPIKPYCCNNILPVQSRWRVWSVQNSPNRLMIRGVTSKGIHRVRRSTFYRVAIKGE